MKKIILLSFMFISAAQAMFAGDFTCTIKNINQPKNTNNVIEFDVYLSNTSKQNLKFQSFQAGINFNYNGLANGGVITGQFVKGSADPKLAANQQSPNWTINPETKQIRLLAAIQTAHTLAPVIPSQGVKLGTFRLTNTESFGSVTPNFEWAFQIANGKTKSAVTAFVENNASGKSITSQKSFSFEKQGPEYFVESNPIINNKPSTTNQVASVVSENINVYPNPVVEFVKVDLSVTKNENVTLKVVDNNGRVVKTVQEEITAGTTTLAVDMKELANGSYILQVYKSGKTVLNKQIIKQ